MRYGFLGSLVALLVGTGMGLAQSKSVLVSAPSDTAGNGPCLLPRGPLETDLTPSNGTPVCCPSNGADPECTEAGPEGSTYRLYVGSEYLLWHTEDLHLAPLLANVSLGTAGVNLGGRIVTLPATAQIQLGGPAGSEGSFADQSGGRFTLGYWLDDCHESGVEASGFFLSTRHIDLTSGTGPSALSFPFAGVGAQVPNILTIAAGTGVTVSASSELWGTEINVRSAKCCTGPFSCLDCCTGPISFTALGGVRYLNFEESLESAETIRLAGIPSQSTLTASGANNSLAFFDSLRTRNQFYGAQLGGSIEWCMGSFFINGTGKFALGDMHQAVDIWGGTTGTNPAVNLAGGLLTSAADLGHHTRSEFAVVSEAGVNFGYNFGCHVRAFAGYNLMCLSNVARPSDQVAFSTTSAQVTVNNTSQTATIVNPGFHFHSSDVLVQGCNFGLEFRY